MIWVACILPVLIVAAKVAIDYRQWLKKRNTVTGKSYTNHWLEWVIMAAASSPSVIIFGVKSSVDWMGSETLNLVAQFAIPAAMIAFFIWLFFDGLYNVFRGFGWWYTGSGESTAANTDKALRKLPLWLHIVIKVGGLAGAIILYTSNLK